MRTGIVFTMAKSGDRENVRVRVTTHDPLPEAQFWMNVVENDTLEDLQERIAQTLISHYDGDECAPYQLHLTLDDFALLDHPGRTVREGDVIVYV